MIFTGTMSSIKNLINICIDFDVLTESVVSPSMVVFTVLASLFLATSGQYLTDLREVCPYNEFCTTEKVRNLRT